MSDQEDILRIKDRIWITAKCRIYAEKRYRRYDVVSHLFLSSLSVIIISLSLLRDALPDNAPIDTYTIVYSVFVLAASVVVFGFKYGETATLHRECYLRLQQLYDSRHAASELERCYHEILSSYPNHSDVDFESLVLNRTFPNKVEGLKRLDGTVINWTFLMLGRWAIHTISLWGAPAVLLAYSVVSIFLFW